MNIPYQANSPLAHIARGVSLSLPIPPLRCTIFRDVAVQWLTVVVDDDVVYSLCHVCIYFFFALMWEVFLYCGNWKLRCVYRECREAFGWSLFDRYYSFILLSEFTGVQVFRSADGFKRVSCSIYNMCFLFVGYGRNTFLFLDILWFYISWKIKRY